MLTTAFWRRPWFAFLSLPWSLIGMVIIATLTAAIASADRLNPLPPEQAFRFSAKLQGEQAIILYSMPSGVYLYRDKLLLTTTMSHARVDLAPLPEGTVHDDPFFGKTTVYYHAVTLSASIDGSGTVEIIALSQGCDEQVGICYPPMQHTATLVVAAPDSASDGRAITNNDPIGKDDASVLSNAIKDRSVLWIIGLFFLLGVGLSLTPCVLPMLPILLGIISGDKKTRRQIVMLTATYISGVVSTFTGLGVLAAITGQLLTRWLQTPPILIVVAVIFALLGVSLLGAYELNMPAFIRHRLANAGRGGGIIGVFLMGALSVLIVSPCVAPPLIGALLYISQSGDVLIGGVALFSLSLGMSVLLAVAGITGGVALPRAGEWTNGVKQLLGLLMLFVAIWTVSPTLPDPWALVLYAFLLLFSGMLAQPFVTPTGRFVVFASLIKALALATLLWGIFLLIGVAAGGRDALAPLSPFTATDARNDQQNLVFQNITTVEELEKITTTSHQPIMLEFFAEWCISCKEFEYFTLTDNRVRQRLKDVVLLRADVTEGNADQNKLLKHFNLFGPPAILFYRADGSLVKETRVTGYQNAEEFLQTLDAAGI